MAVPGPRSRPPAQDEVVDADADDDDDDDDDDDIGTAGENAPSACRGAPGAAPRPAARRRGALVAAAVTGALLAGGSAAVHERGAAAQRAREAQGEPSLDAGAPTGTALVTGVADGAGWSDYGVAVPLANRGSRSLDVLVEGLGVPGVRAAPTSVPVTVPAGETRVVQVALAVRCARFPVDRSLPQDGAEPAPRAPLRVRVGESGTSGPGRPVTLTAAAPGPAGRSLVAQLALACDGGGSAVGLALRATPAGPRQLSVQLGSAAGEAGLVPPDAQVAVRVTPGIVVSTPPAPWHVPSGRTTTALLGVEPDCRVVGDGTASRLGLVVVGPSGTVTGTVADPEQQLTAWLTRQIALRCG